MSERVLVVTSGAHFVRGGHMVIAEQTVEALRREGHEAELLVTPQNRFGRQLAAYMATWLTDVGETADGKVIDRVISFRFPSYAIRHPRHVCWLNHRMREYYDLWERFVRGLGRRGRLKESIRRSLFHALDKRLLTRAGTRVVAQSKTIQQRLQRFGGIESDLVYPPAPERPYRNDGYGDYVFAVSRLHPLKRVDLLVEAAAKMEDRSLRFRIAGDGESRAAIEARVRELGLESRVELLGSIDEAELVRQYAGCRAVFFAPKAEDYGFVTLEAFRSGKAVITASDSGGPAELVTHDQTGTVTAADPTTLASQLDRLGADEGLAERMGAAALAHSERFTWSGAVSGIM